MRNLKLLIVILLVGLTQMGIAQLLPVNCNLAIPGCSTPSFPIVGTQPSYNTIDFTSGSISNPSTNPQGVNTGCLLSGETVSTFITINVSTSGTLQWSMIGTAGGCFDWIMWPVATGDVSQACAGINGNSLPPVACNWNGTCNGNTGMAAAGSLPPGGSPTSYQPPITVVAGQSYILCLSNYSFTNQNVNLNFFGSAQVVCSVSAPDQTICLGNSATVTIVTPGLNNPQFNWLVTTGVSNTSGGTNITVTPSVTTTYQVEVFQPATINSSAFLDTATFTITVIPPPTPNAGIDDTLCLGQPIFLNGTISNPANTPSWQFLTTGITPTPTVTFAPNFNSLTPTVTVNQVGLYQFILRENNPLCGMYRDTVRVLVTNITQTTSVVAPSCFGFSDGEISIDSPLAEEYSFDNGTSWVTNSTQGGFAAGTYTVCSRNFAGCLTCSQVTVVNPPAITISVSNDTLICQNGTAQLSALAGNGTTYSFHWDHTTDLNAVQLVNPLANITYSVYAESENGCLSPTESIVVSVRAPISGTLSPETEICPGYPTTLTATASGGIGVPFTFVWNMGGTGTGSDHTITANPPATATYTVTITDGCESTPLVLSTVVNVAPLPVPQISVNMNNQCEPVEYILTNETDPSMVDLVYWEISNGDIFVNEEVVTTSTLWSGLYNVQLIVTSPQGCIDSTTFFNYLFVNPKPVADFRYSPNPVLMFNTNVWFVNYSINGETYEWFLPGSNMPYSQMENPQVQYPIGEVADYEVMLIATSEFGCIDTAYQIVSVQPEVIFYAPNSFTPDNDEFNQSWGIHIEGIDVYDFELLIFNRWGEIIWESRDPEARWDGTYNGNYVQQGVYTWVIRTKDKINDNKYVYNGFINLMK
jgi:gliding motility-associated-like protein